MKKKLNIAVKNYPRTIASFAIPELTRDRLVIELKARKIPVPKTKEAMTQRLTDYVRKNKVPVTVTIG